MDEGNRVIGRRNEVVERPRLTKLLDQTEAPVVLLIAPAGYGKTTLARQWLSGRRAAWYRATSSASDAAALIAGLANAARDIVPDFGERALARLGAGFPGADAASLAHVLREDLADWPSDDWLVIDDYQFVAQSRDTDALIGTIADASRLNLLITSRVRPAWATARKILYGEVFELGHQLLAMDVNEARAVMAHAGRDPVAGLVALAAGWPAVIGMAAASTATDVPEDVLEDRLYEFFASEVLESLHADTRGALAEIAIAPEPTLSVVHEIAGEHTQEFIAETSRAGLLLAETGSRYYLHPLLRELLTARVRSGNPGQAIASASRVAAALVESREWDGAFEVAREWEIPGVVENLLSLAADELLNAGRIVSLQEWIRCARALGITAPIVDMIDAECAFRSGDSAGAERLAVRAERLAVSDEDAQRALTLAAQAAYFDDRPRAATGYTNRAANFGRSSPYGRRAIYLEFLASLELEDEATARRLVAELVAIGESDEDALRCATCTLQLAIRFGGVDGAIRDTAGLERIAEGAASPMASSSFFEARAKALQLAAQYEEASDVVKRAAKQVADASLDFAVPQVLTTQARVAFGLGRFKDAVPLVQAVQDAVGTDPHLAGNAAILKAQYFFHTGRPDDALTVLSRAPDAPDAGTRGEVAAYSALASAALQNGSAAKYADQAVAVTRTAESRVVAALARALDANESPIDIDAALAPVRETGFRDVLVTALRVLNILRPGTAQDAEGSLAPDVADLYRRWVQPFEVSKGVPALTKRENEVLALVAEGRSTREIATRLFISEPTVKVHLRHIYEKLGVRNRAGAVALAASYAATSSSRSAMSD